MRPVRIGCSGWNYRDWREAFYPRGLPPSRWLEHYSTVFDTVEVNATFYRLASPAAVEAWVEQTPPDFVFAVKSSRYLTHVKRLRDPGPGAARFFESIAPLRASPKLGPVLWQLPESFRRDDERLVATLESAPPGRHCFEFRHPSWFTDDVYAILAAHGAALVAGDHPKWPHQARELTADWGYIRLHHGRRGRHGNYSKRELGEWAELIRAWRRSAEVFVYLNNDWSAYAPRNALMLRALLDDPAG